ncbi:phosphotransferase enzyme family protein [Methylocucumis oryzae]|uniref:Aminoglycoside phosphotransferase domain-containing protein n=1 Tax=Methylocucumis oryzae TaxID=1632867 RepID=A0A0F3IFF4_9GAMM|nr:aminoglycoside phosphotransferase family protein [Methylocucumis oryzae]KJV05422.1 hypothetical protein VZ94_18340 [Methylocucumis oryzae]
MNHAQNASVPVYAAVIAERFATNVLAISRLGNGLINDTYLVRSTEQSFVLQKINTSVFPKPQAIIENFLLISEHIRLKPKARLQIPTLMLTQNEELWVIDDTGEFWRAQSFIADTYNFDALQSPKQAIQTGLALGHFHFLFSDLPTSLLNDTLPGFHITPGYLATYHSIANTPYARSAFCERFIEQFAPEADKLERAKQQGILPMRVIHGDPKLNNFLFNQPGQAISLIDLDTVKPGLLHYDIGDCLRSCCHNHDDDSFNLDYCTLILEAYLSEIGSIFSSADFDYLHIAIRLIPFELGLRFYTDHLLGNRYFKTQYACQNLERAEALFRLCASIDAQQIAMSKIIKQLAKASI